MEAVTAEDVRRVGERYFRRATQQVVVGGDVATVQPALAMYGPSEVVKP